MLPPDIRSKPAEEDLQGGNLKNALHSEVMMQVSTGSVRYRAEVSGKMRDNEILDGTKRGDLDCLHRPYQSRIEGHMLLIFASRLKRVNIWGEQTFEVA